MVTFYKCNSVEDAIARAQWLFTVYMGKPVCSRFGQVNFVPESHSGVPFTEKPPRKGETGIKDGFEEMEHGFPFEILRPGKLDCVNFSDVMFLPRISNFSPTRLQKSCSIYFSYWFLGNIFVNGKQKQKQSNSTDANFRLKASESAFYFVLLPGCLWHG